MGLGDFLKGWLFSRAAKKAAVTLAQGIASYAIAHAGKSESWGVSVGVDPNALAAALLAGSEVARNFLKFKFPKLFGWM